MDNSMVIFQKYGLVNSSLTYSEIANAFLTLGYTSKAGNTYFSALRIGEGLLIKEDIGEASYGSFLNAVRIFSLKSKTLLAENIFNGKWYSENAVKSVARKMLLDLLKEAHLKGQISFDEDFANRQIDRVLDIAFNEDQRKKLEDNAIKYLK